MFSRPGWHFSSVCLFAVLSACAEGAPSEPADQLPAVLPEPMTTCGDGIKDKNEMCDCPKGADMMCEAPETVTCESLMMGTGMVYCKALECTFIMDFCSAGAVQVGGGAGVGVGATTAGRGG